MIAEELLRAKEYSIVLVVKTLSFHALIQNMMTQTPSMRVDRVTGVMHCFSCGLQR